MLISLVLLTLTIDRYGTRTGLPFDEPEEAFDTVTDGHYIARLMKALQISKWVCVLEFQSRTGDGWPHWHVLMDVSHFPGKRLPKHLLGKAWKLWRDHWRIGGLDVKLDTKKTPVHAIHYATKYLTKYPERGFPEWVMRRSRVRFVSASKRVGALIAKAMTDDQRAKAAERQAMTRRLKNQPASRKRAAARPSFKRIAKCGESTTFIIQKSSGQSHYFGSCPARVEDLWLISCHDPSLSSVVARKQDGGYMTFELELNNCDRRHNPKQALAMLDYALHELGQSDRREKRIREFEVQLLNQWDEHGLRQDPPSDVDGS